MAEMATCYECGETFSHEDMIKYDDNWICAACKPIFLQKLREGIHVGNAMDYAAFWTRFAAWLLDQIIISVVNQFVGMSLLTDGAPLEQQLAMLGVVACIQMSIYATYDTIFVGKFGATPGKMACNLKVVSAEGEPVSYGRAVGRHFAKYLSLMIVGVGYFMAAFDEEKRALHDRICNTRVIKK